MHLNKQITTNATNDTIAIKWLLIFPFSDLLRAISVIKGKKNEQGPLIVTEDKSTEKSFQFQPYYPRQGVESSLTF